MSVVSKNSFMMGIKTVDGMFQQNETSTRISLPIDFDREAFTKAVDDARFYLRKKYNKPIYNFNIEWEDNFVSVSLEEDTMMNSAFEAFMSQ